MELLFVIGILYWFIKRFGRGIRKPVRNAAGNHWVQPTRSFWREWWDIVVRAHWVMRIKKAERMGYLARSNERTERLERPALAAGCQEPSYRRER